MTIVTFSKFLYGVSRQLLAAGIPLNTLRYIFITHHHSDHNLEYGALLYNAWITGRPEWTLMDRRAGSTSTD